jgi:hypothetical protein
MLAGYLERYAATIHVPQNNLKEVRMNTLTVTFALSLAISVGQSSAIRSVDFNNFIYPELSNLRGKFALKDGREPRSEEPRSLVDVVYGDVTGDGREEAMVVQSQSIKGSAVPFFVYVYNMERGRPRLLWSFYAGERGDGGLRQVYSDGGQLVVELYGRDRVVNGGTSVMEDNGGVCCPRFFTRSRYWWRGGNFRLMKKEAAIPNPQGNAAYLRLTAA